MALITTNEEGEFTAQLKGEFHWDLVIDIDNTKNVSVSIKRALAVVREVSLSYDALVRSLEFTQTVLSFGGGTLEVHSVGVNGDLHEEVKAEYENLPKSKTASVKKTPTEAVTYEVGPGSSLKLHRLVFKAPGVTYLTDTLSTSTDAIPHVPIEVKGRLLPALKGVAALYSSASASELKVRPVNKVAKLANNEGHFKADLNGEFYWELFMEIDNSKSSGSITRDMDVETVVSLSHTNMVHSVESHLNDISAGFEVGGGLLDLFSVSVKTNLSSEVKSQYENLTETKKDTTNTTSKADSYAVGAGGSLTLYRRIFKGPGVAYMTDSISSSPDIRSEVPIEIIGRRVPVLKDIEVVYTHDDVSRPDDIIVEARGRDPNLRSGRNHAVRNGELEGPLLYVWLRPIWTLDVAEGITGIQIANQVEKNERYEDLSKGDGGLYRYFKMLRDPHSKRRITEIVMWQVTDEETKGGDDKKKEPPSELYQFSAHGVCYDFQGNVMYLAWNTRSLKYSA